MKFYISIPSLWFVSRSKIRDVMSLKLFTNVLEDIVKTLKFREGTQNKVNGEYIYNLCFADDIFAEMLEKLGQMLGFLNRFS